MKILFVINKKEQQTLMDELLKTDSLEEVIEVLSGIRDRSTFVEIINELLNKLSEEKQERIHLERKLKEKEVEIL